MPLPEPLRVPQLAAELASVRGTPNEDAYEVVVPPGFVRAVPPAPPIGWLDALPEGATLEVRHAGGWFGAVALSRRGVASARRSTVKFVLEPSPGSALPLLGGGQIERTAGVDDLRPFWLHQGKRDGYRMGHDTSIDIDQAVPTEEVISALEIKAALDNAINAAASTEYMAATAAAAAAGASEPGGADTARGAGSSSSGGGGGGGSGGGGGGGGSAAATATAEAAGAVAGAGRRRGIGDVDVEANVRTMIAS